MYLTTHAAVGVLISQQTQNPWIAFFGSFVSHFVLDFVPHGDEDVGRWAIVTKKRLALVSLLDLAGIVMLLFALVNVIELPRFGLVVLGVIGSVLPDFLVNVFPILHRLTQRNPMTRLLHWLHRKTGFAYVVSQHERLHHLLHNPWHRLLPISISQEIGLLVQLFILVIFFATEISVLGK